MQTITPYLYYEDVAAALHWLEKAFGFKEYGHRFTGPDGKIKHAAMKLKGGLIMMGCPGEHYKNPRRIGRATQCLHITVSDIAKYFERAKKAGATVLHEPEYKFYGQRQFGAADLEGHHWYFAEPIRTTKKPSKSNIRNT